MSTRRDHDRSISAWLVSEAPDRAPDDVLEASRHRLRHTRQRRAWLPAWRYNPMNSYAKLAGAVAAVLVVGFVGYQLIPGLGGPGAPGGSHSPPPTAPTTASPAAQVSPSPAPTAEPTTLAYTLTPFAGVDAVGMCPGTDVAPDCAEDPRDESIVLTFGAPPSWTLFGSLGPWIDDNGPPGGAAVFFYRGNWLASEPCRPDAEMIPDIAVGPTVDDFVSALVDRPSLDVTAPVDVTLAGFAGKYLDLQVPDDIRGCDTYQPIAGHIYAQGPGHRWHMWILDVNGVRVVVETNDYAGTPPERLAEIQLIVDSIVITP
jgi:hypothetical protein